MIRIAVCDDEITFAENAASMCRSILKARPSKDFIIDTFTSGSALIAKYNSGVRYDIVLLDIMMEEVDGMSVAAFIRKKDVHVPILFVTSTMDFALKGYEVKAFRYLMKPLDRSQLEDAVDRILAEKKREWFIARDGNGLRKIGMDDIIYFEIAGRKTAVNTTNGRFLYNGKLRQVAGMLDPERFTQCHQSYIVNLKHIFEIRRYEIILKNKDVIPASRTYWENVRSAFLRRMSE